MNDIVSLPKSLRDRIEKLSRLRKVTPKSFVREAITERVAYLEWEEKALAQGQADLDSGRVMTTDQLRNTLSEQRARRARKAAKQLEWSLRAARDVLAIDTYLSAENPNAAFEVVEHIIKRAEQLRRYAFLGYSLGSGRPRKLVLTRYPYNIHYRLTASRVRILRVLHQARRLP